MNIKMVCQFCGTKNNNSEECPSCGRKCFAVKTDEKEKYIRISDNEHFTNSYACTIDEAKQTIEDMVEQFDIAHYEDDPEVLCFKVVEMTRQEFKNLPEFTGF